ncbi:transposase [Sphingomonas sp. 35-24ZXX]|uniref:transposase n=1 Tax=Sphingomonas sp. 35-24ZXX TaxID=1545915 RepID=UPI0009DF6163|nr:transposase [Sphingomonas sp. 35-24ZXX]
MSRFTEKQIIRMIKEQKGALSTAEAYRKHVLNPTTLYELCAKCGGFEVSNVWRLKLLEQENSK